MLSCDGHHVFVAVKSDQTIGFLHCFKRTAIEKGPELVIQAIAVTPRHRNKGAATMMLGAAESLASTLGCDAVALHARRDRDAAHRFYTGRGYTVAASSSLFRKSVR